MSYLVLARKYRPRDFEGLVGQEHVVQALGNALTQQRLHHAYLFTGTRGVGKTTVSRILAKALNCTGADGQGGITAHPCGVCDACREIDAGRFVDYVELDAASNRGVDEIGQLLDQSVYKPVVGRFKLYMIDEVHMLSTHAFNALLKTLEEPPEYLKFVLATTDPQKVPPTVLSRCLQFNLRPMAPQTVQLHLADVLDKEQIESDAGALRLLSRAARGSMRDALSLTDQAIAFGNGRLDEPGVRQMLGAVDRTHALRILEALAGSDGAALVAAVDGLRTLGLSGAGTLEELSAMVQQMAVLQAVPTAADEADPDSPRLAAMAGRFQADELQLIYSIALHGREELGLAPDEYSGLVMVLLRMLAFMPRPDGSRAEPAARERAAGAAEPAAASAAASSVRPAASPPEPRVDKMVPPVSAAAPGPGARSESARPEAPSARIVEAAESSPASGRPVSKATSMGAPQAQARVRPSMPEPPAWVDAPFDDDGYGASSPLSSGTAFSSSEPMPEPELREEAIAADDPFETAPALQGRGKAADGEAGMPESAQPAADPHDFERTAFGEQWAEVVGRMVKAGAIMAMVRELALQAECMGVEPIDGGGERWLLRVERETLRGSASCQKLQAALSTTLGRTVKLDTESGPTGDTPARRAAAARAARQREAEHIIESDPFVQSLMREYKGAHIVRGSVRPVDDESQRTTH